MDATPVMLGQEFGGYAATVHSGERLDGVLPRVRELPLGGTAVGTGINTPPGFAARVIEELAAVTGQESPRPATTQGPGHPGLAGRAQRVLRRIAVGVTKICNDLRWMSSGPTAGLAGSTCPTCSPGRASGPARSTRCSRRPP